MKKFVSILMVAIASMILCTACDPTVSEKDKGNDPPYPIELTTYEEFMTVVEEMGGQSAFTVYTSTFVVPMMRPIWDEEGWSMCTSFNRMTDHVIEFVRNGSYYYAVVGEEGRAEAEAIVNSNSGADPKVINTYEKYTGAIENVRKSDATGSVAVAYVNKNTPWGCDLGLNNSYVTPEFFATVDEAVKFDEYTIKVKMKGKPLEYVYIYNSKHSIPAIEDADLIYRELN